MKIVFFSDIHGNNYVVEPFMEMLKNLKVDKIIFCGDVFGYYYGQNYIIEELKKMKLLSCIKGNHDVNFLNVLKDKSLELDLIKKYGNSYLDIGEKISLDNKNFIESLPTKLLLEYKGKKIMVTHGTPNDLLNGRLYPKDDIKEENFSGFDYIILGHTHFKMLKSSGKTTIINPGSIGQQRDGHGFGFVVLSLPDGKLDFHNISFDIEKLEKEIKINDPGNYKLIEILYRKV